MLTEGGCESTMNIIQLKPARTAMQGARWLKVGDNDLGLRYWQNQRLSRRRLLGGVAVGGAAVAAIGLGGCSSSKNNNNGGSGKKTVSRAAAKIQGGTQDGPAKPRGNLHIQQRTARASPK